MAKLGIIISYVYRMGVSTRQRRVREGFGIGRGIEKSEANRRIRLLLHNRNRTLSSIDTFIE